MRREIQLTPTEYKHISLNDNGQPVLTDIPRFKVRHLVEAYAYRGSGVSVEEMAGWWEGVTPAQVHAALLYYHDNPAEINADIERLEQLEREWEERERNDPEAQAFREKLREKLRKARAARRSRRSKPAPIFSLSCLALIAPPNPRQPLSARAWKHAGEGFSSSWLERNEFEQGGCVFPPSNRA